MEEAADADQIFLRSAASSSIAMTHAMVESTGATEIDAQAFGEIAGIIRAELA
jgi:hypothetical protein